MGYDINCGVRLLVLPVSARELAARKEQLVHEISRVVPVGTGRDGGLDLANDTLERVLRDGPRPWWSRGSRPGRDGGGGQLRQARAARRRRRGRAPHKDVEKVVDVVERAGLAARVAQLRPLGVVKG